MVKQTDAIKAPAEVSVKLFRSFHDGMGDADEVRFNHRMEDYASVQQVTAKYNRGHGSIDARAAGQIRMGMQVKRMAQTNHDLRPVFATEWTDTTGVYPNIFYLVGKKIMRIQFGAVTEVGVNALATNATGGMFDDDGSGIPYLYACFGGTSLSAKIRRMDRANTVTTSADVWAALMLSLNGKAYRTVTPTSGTANCQVDVCPYGKDRFVDANWVGEVTVGFAGTDINVLTAVRQAPVCVKPEGVFVYNQGLDQWINMTPGWRSFMHPRNGIGSFFLGDQLIIPMGDGGAYVFNGASVKPFDPVAFDATPNLHTTKSQFSSMAALRHWIIGATNGVGDGYGAAKLQSMGNSLRFFFTTDDIAFTDRSTQVRNLDLTDGASLPNSATLKVYIGWTRPFTAFRFDTGLANAVAGSMTVKVGTAVATYTSVGVVDMTALAGATLGQSGDVIMTADPVGSLAWIPTAVNGVTLYWAQLTFSMTPTNNTSWLNCQIQPWYPSVDYANFPLDGLDKSGCFPHLLYGRGDIAEQGNGWHDMVSLSRPDLIGCVLFPNVGGSGLNKSRHLIAIGRFNVWQVLTADDDKSATEAAPILNDVGLIEAASIVPSPGSLVRLKWLKINGHDCDPAWKLLFYYTWDAGKPWSRASTELRVPAFQEFNSPSNKGYRFRWAIGFAGTAGEALSQPVITEIEAGFEVLTAPIDSTQERAVQNPPRV